MDRRVGTFPPRRRIEWVTRNNGKREPHSPTTNCTVWKSVSVARSTWVFRIAWNWPINWASVIHKWKPGSKTDGEFNLLFSFFNWLSTDEQWISCNIASVNKFPVTIRNWNWITNKLEWKAFSLVAIIETGDHLRAYTIYEHVVTTPPKGVTPANFRCYFIGFLCDLWFSRLCRLHMRISMLFVCQQLTSRRCSRTYNLISLNDCLIFIANWRCVAPSVERANGERRARRMFVECEVADGINSPKRWKRRRDHAQAKVSRNHLDVKS